MLVLPHHQPVVIGNLAIQQLVLNLSTMSLTESSPLIVSNLTRQTDRQTDTQTSSPSLIVSNLTRHTDTQTHRHHHFVHVAALKSLTATSSVHCSLTFSLTRRDVMSSQTTAISSNEKQTAPSLRCENASRPTTTR